IELDVHMTRDRKLVVHHDPSLHSAIPGDRGPPIAELTLADVRARTPADWPISTLDEVLDLVGTRAAVYVEVKAPGAEAEVVAVLRAHPTPTAVHAFDHRIVRRVRQLDPSRPTGILMSSYLLDPIAPLRETGARDLWQEASMVDAALIGAVHD